MRNAHRRAPRRRGALTCVQPCATNKVQVSVAVTVSFRKANSNRIRLWHQLARRADARYPVHAEEEARALPRVDLEVLVRPVGAALNGDE